MEPIGPLGGYQTIAVAVISVNYFDQHYRLSDFHTIVLTLVSIPSYLSHMFPNHLNYLLQSLLECISSIIIKAIIKKPVPGPNRAWLSVVYFSRQASQLSVYQSHDYHVYIPYTILPTGNTDNSLWCLSISTVRNRVFIYSSYW